MISFLLACVAEKKIQSQETVTNSVPAEMVHLRHLTFAGSTEVFINMTLTELAKSENQEKASLEKELFELIESYHFFDTKSTPNRTTRGHFLSVSSLLVLLQVAIRVCNNSVSAKHTQDRTQSHTQPSSSKKPGNYPKIVPFAFNACLRHLQYLNSSKGIFNEDLKRLCVLISQLTLLLVPDQKIEAGPKKKNAKSKGDQLYVALTCLNEMLKMNLPKDKLTELIMEMIAAMLPENEKEIEELINDFGERFVGLICLFLERGIKPMFSLLVSLSLNAESEVTWFIRICNYSCKLRYNSSYHDNSIPR